MTTIHIFDSPSCSSSAACDSGAGPESTRVAADLKWLSDQGVEIRRYDLAREPMAFASHATVKQILDERGDAGLPVIMVDGSVVAEGEYPSRAQLAALLGVQMQSETAASSGDGERALPDSIVELIAMAAAVVADDERSLRHHHQRAESLGVEREEMIEAINVALHVKGRVAQSTVTTAQRLLVPEAAEGGGCCGGSGSGGCGCN